jgi:hypothetical protein
MALAGEERGAKAVHLSLRQSIMRAPVGKVFTSVSARERHTCLLCRGSRAKREQSCGSSGSILIIFRSAESTGQRLVDPPNEHLQEPNRIDPDRPRNLQEFNDIDAALATLVFGHEGLMLAEPFGQLLLCKPRTVACLYHQLPEGGLLRRMD